LSCAAIELAYAQISGRVIGAGPTFLGENALKLLASKQQEAIFRTNMSDSLQGVISKAHGDMSKDIAVNLFLAKTMLAPLIVCQLPNMQVYFQGHFQFGATAIRLEKFPDAFLSSGVLFSL
jgi:hypothetical protein